MDKNTWKEIAILLLLIIAIIFVMEVFAPTLIDKVWDMIRNILPLPQIFLLIGGF